MLRYIRHHLKVLSCGGAEGLNVELRCSKDLMRPRKNRRNESLTQAWETRKDNGEGNS